MASNTPADGVTPSNAKVAQAAVVKTSGVKATTASAGRTRTSVGHGLAAQGLAASAAEAASLADTTPLRFLTCGSVDDGKSTLIGRLLYDTKLIFEDTLATLERDSKRHGTTGEEIDFALLVDGLEAEREQNNTNKNTNRFFATDKRKFIVADTPGHEQY